MQGIFLLLRNDFKIDQYVLVLVKGFVILFEMREEYFSFLASIKDFNSLGDIQLNSLGDIQLY